MHITDSTRKLWVLHGDATILFTKLTTVVGQNQGDWITVTNQANLPTNLFNVITSNQTKQLLGQEFKHAIFDATQAFNLDALTMLIGTLVNGSVLILLLPEDFSHWQDHDSLRWNENPCPIKVPNFIAHLKHVLAEHNYAVNHQINNLDNAFYNLQEQQNVLKQLLQSTKTIKVVIAKRGRGKSALVGQFSHYHHCLVTAPNKNSLITFFRFAKTTTPFYAPDELITANIDPFPEYLIIDEAAMIPLPILAKLLQLAISKCSQILLTTTVEGYEGTGQGFLLKLLADQPCDYFYLQQPIRWYADDQLEQFSDHLMLNAMSTFVTQMPMVNQTTNYSLVDRQDIPALQQIYHLLKNAHYQTTLVDLRRLFDAQNLLVWQAKIGDQRVAAAVTINEGNLTEALINEIWKGNRRPKGNLVAQSLVAHAGEKLAAKLQSLRINRIAVIELYRRQHIAQNLVQSISNYAIEYGKDFVSVSFAFSDDNYRFWLACGFNIVHIASRKETSSGTYSVMAIKAISQSGQILVEKLQHKLQRNSYWLKQIIDLPFDQIVAFDSDQGLTNADIEELYGFCYYHRPYESTYAALCRLHNYNHTQTKQIDLPILNALLANNTSELPVIQQLQLTGKNALMQALKQELAKWFASRR
ncbi:tRNA(Met) cytidine acetyltransferase TmcA domain-containing protein [Gilliamella sp. wkB112]|uniref:tRNA(Met) cytidine acetyltransferase TmcA domain-containing protein n=1 Tax=Gilliamella sp. wkB112 TaxID=3120257 RepID=UPI00080ED2F4|nr:tRNA(Met) cytidine acetyltransferase TmcA domain-containing protein [Gilliamella apicola]OCG01022.1 hypothetical protein A9G12_00190 [Gilliamella apicola]